MASSTYKESFLSLCHQHQILKFGTFTVKSGRISPYFFNAGSFSNASLLSSLAIAYAQAIASSKVEFDVIFGPAYKGIPLCAIAAIKLAELDPAKYGPVGWCFNRKEAKDHGEGGSLVGASIKDKRVLIIDDVITAGTAKREAVEIIKANGGSLAGIVVALDRQERAGDGGPDDQGLSAIGVLKKEYDVPMITIITFADIIRFSKDRLTTSEINAMEKYRDQYGSVDI